MTTRLRTLLLLAIASAGPAMLALDFLLRHVLVGSQPADVRAFLADRVTPIAWCVAPFPVLGGIVGFRWYPSRVRRGLERWARDPSIAAETASMRAEIEALLLTTTLAQLPAILGDFALILGARPAPALCSTGASVVAIVAIGLFAPRR